MVAKSGSSLCSGIVYTSKFITYTTKNKASERKKSLLNEKGLS